MGLQYYTVEDVMKITGSHQNKAYEIIRELNKKFKREFPDSIYMQGKVMKWYFDEKMGIKKDDIEVTNYE